MDPWIASTFSLLQLMLRGTGVCCPTLDHRLGHCLGTYICSVLWLQYTRGLPYFDRISLVRNREEPNPYFLLMSPFLSPTCASGTERRLSMQSATSGIQDKSSGSLQSLPFGLCLCTTGAFPFLSTLGEHQVETFEKKQLFREKWSPSY